MQELFYRLPDEDVRTRFFQNLKSLTDTAAEHLCSVDYEGEMAFAAVIGPDERERIVGTVSYYVDPRTGLADVGYMVDPEWQGAGLGGLLHARAVEYARAHGVRGFTADVMVGNSRMLRVFRRGDHDVSLTTESAVTEVTMIFAS
jgi:RimJ/RimL family protein N-acetyltransferase